MKKLVIALLLVSVMFGTVYRPVAAQEQTSAAEQKRLFRKGAKLWPIYCNQCHNARPGSEKAPYEWRAITMHMRMLGNIPADDFRALRTYLTAK
ncbi:MAG: hypothetical protein ABSD31_09130 [Candidatus Binataceae bacterium]|jgi:hypothetical protein